ncbi:demethylspheroidene O-methyltransferase [Fulvimarina manganoxydans]|uniref:Demethylspheroidene O-methyltransferase n=1 Tax=Fulvimarina manganoxydans TaxID=937218 RepID=A0A1W2ENQ3_9HYPH|nr:methyltransferase [Fulvimarina manganoxydans]SMD11172.1 demethylspheroidene O-methyltransferase [Fulvimarina manganoxydans]
MSLSDSRPSAPIAGADKAPRGSSPLSVRWRDIRNRALMSPRFHAIALATPIGRFFARRSADKLFDLTAGFVYSQILFAGVQTGLFEALAEGPAPEEDLARRLEMPLDGARRLLSGSAALGLLDKLPDGRFMLGAQGAALLANPGAIAMIRHHDAFYDDLRDPVEVLKIRGGGRLARLWDYDGQSADTRPEGRSTSETTRYTKLMEASQDLVAREALRLFDVRPFKRILDLGGGSGRFLTALAERNETAQLHLFDRPDVAILARERLDIRPDADRFRVHGGSFFADSLPDRCDLVTLVRILHDHDDEPAMNILRRARTALAPGGRILIAEPMADRRAHSRIGDAYFNLYLAAMGSGRPRTPEEIAEMLGAAGFSKPRTIPAGMPIATSAVTAVAT